jgi:hypothetical protein
MAEVLLINPRKRRKARKATRRTRRNPAAPIAVTRSRNRAAFPFQANPKRRRRRRAGAVRRWRSNPIQTRGVLRGLFPMLQNAAIGAGGAVAVDFAMGKLNPMLPETLRTTPGTVGAGDAVKAVVTVALGQLLSRFTRGHSRTAAQGALTVQADKIIRSMLPADIKSQLGWWTAGPVIQGSARIPPVATNSLDAYVRRGAPSPLLNGTGAYMRPGVTPLLNGARSRENAVR